MECLGSETPVSCFVAANDFIAYGVLDALDEKGLRVPEDYSVCVFNNLSSSRISNVGLTTVEHQTDSRARHAFSILMERTKGNAPQTRSSIWNTRIYCRNGVLQRPIEKAAWKKNNGHNAYKCQMPLASHHKEAHSAFSIRAHGTKDGTKKGCTPKHTA
jgi:hypothetical protein